MENTAARQRALNRLIREGLTPPPSIAPSSQASRTVSLEVVGVSPHALPDVVSSLGEAGIVPFRCRAVSPGHVTIVIDFSDFSWARLLSVSEVARMMGIGRAAVYRLLRSGKLAGAKVGGKWRVCAEAVFEFLRREGLVTAEEAVFDGKAR